MSGDCCLALPRGAMGLSAVCNCVISRSYSLTIFVDANFHKYKSSRNDKSLCHLQMLVNHAPFESI